MEFEELESVERLDDLMSKIQEAQKMSQEMKERLDNLQQMLMEEPNPAEVDAFREKIAKLEAEKAEFDEMTSNAAAEAKTRLAAVREASEKKFGEDLVASANARRNAETREDQFILNEEKITEEIKAKTEAMKARARERALAQAKEIARRSNGTPEEISRIEAEEARRIIDEEYAKIDEIANGQLDKLKNRTLKNEKNAEYQELLATQATTRAVLDGYSSFLDAEFPDVVPLQVKKEEQEISAAEQYTQSKALKEQTEQAIGAKKEELKKLDEELAAHPEKAEELKAKKEALEGDLAKLEETRVGLDKILADLKEKYGLGDDDKGKGKDDDGDDKGKGKGKDDDDGKPKTDAEKKKALEEEYTKLDEEYKRLEAELVKKRAELQLAPDNEALKQEITKLQDEQQKVWRDRNGKKIQIGALEKKIREAEEAARQGGSGKGDDKPVPVKGDAYYDSLSPWGKYKMKKEAYELTEGVGASDMSFLRKALLFLPSNKYSALAGKMLSSGEIKPLQGDIPMLEEAAREEASKKPEHRDPFDTLTPEQKAKAQEEAAKAAKAQEEAAREGKPQQEQPKREGGER